MEWDGMEGGQVARLSKLVVAVVFNNIGVSPDLNGSFNH